MSPSASVEHAALKLTSSLVVGLAGEYVKQATGAEGAWKCSDRTEVPAFPYGTKAALYAPVAIRRTGVELWPIMRTFEELTRVGTPPVLSHTCTITADPARESRVTHQDPVSVTGMGVVYVSLFGPPGGERVTRKERMGNVPSSVPSAAAIPATRVALRTRRPTSAPIRSFFILPPPHSLLRGVARRQTECIWREALMKLATRRHGTPLRFID